MTGAEAFNAVIVAWGKSVEAEKARRSAILDAYPEGAGICQDDYEWATMTGTYTADCNCLYHVEPNGHVWRERFM